MITKLISASQQTFFQIENGACSASIFLQGAHLAHWQPHHTAEPVIWLSKEAIFKQGVAIRGGIPICWPWFGDMEGEASHGFARNLDWDLIKSESHENLDELHFLLRSSAETKKIRPWDFDLIIIFKLGKSLEVSLTTKNLGSESFEITQAIHTYFQVGEVSKISLTGLDGCYYKDKTKNGAIAQHFGPFRFSQEHNNIFSSNGPIEIFDEELNRKISIVKSEDSLDTVIWNPYIERSKAFKDMADDGYKTMVCVEAGNVGENAVAIKPGQEAMIFQHISVENT